MVVMVATMMFLPTLDVLQLQVDHVMLWRGAAIIYRLQVTVQILVTEPVTAKRLGGQVVPRLDRLYGTVVAPVR